MTTGPTGWHLMTVRDICLPVSKVDPANLGRDHFQYVDIGSIESDAMAVSSPQLLAVEDAPSRARQLLATGDTVFSTVRPYLKKIAWIPENLDGEIASTGFCVLRPNRAIVDPRFLFHYATSDALLDQVLPLQRGVSYPAVRDGDVLGAKVPLPPLDEQRRIVAILEDHLSRLDAAVSSLHKADALVETAVLAIRQQALVGDLHPLGDVAEVVGGIQKQPKRTPRSNAAPFLRVANVTSQGLDLSEVHEIELFEGEIDKYRLSAGDLLVVEGNGSASQIGRAATWQGEIDDCVHQNHLIRVRPGKSLNPAYLELVWNAPSMRRRLSAVASSTSGLHTLSVAKLKSLVIPVPDSQVQAQLVARYEDLRSQMTRADLAVDASLARSASLRRGLLHSAFSGHLTKESLSV